MLRHFSCVRLFATPWTIDHQARMSMGFTKVIAVLDCCQGTFNRRIPACCFLFLKDSLFLIGSSTENE